MVVAKSGEDEPTNLLAVTSNNLGCYYKKVGKLHAALSYLRKALKIEVSLQTDDVTVAGTHLNICAILSKLDKHDKAVLHAECALQLISARVENGEGVTQDEHSVLAIAYHNVAVERDYLHQWDEAANAYLSGFQVAKKCLGEQHPLTQTLGKNVDVALRKTQKRAGQSAAGSSSLPTAGSGTTGTRRTSRPAAAPKQQSKCGRPPDMVAFQPPHPSEKRPLADVSSQSQVPFLPDLASAGAGPIGIRQNMQQQDTDNNWIQNDAASHSGATNFPWPRQAAQASIPHSAPATSQAMSSQAMSVPSFSSAAAATPSLLPAVKQREDGVTAAHSTEQHLGEVETPLAVAPAAERRLAKSASSNSSTPAVAAHASKP
jgi:hypothetical protein